MLVMAILSPLSIRFVTDFQGSSIFNLWQFVAKIELIKAEVVCINIIVIWPVVITVSSQPADTNTDNITEVPSK